MLNGTMSKKSKKIILIAVLILVSIYGFFVEPNMLTVTHYKIKDENLSGIKAVFVGDFHFKPNQQKRLKRVVELVNNENPDIVLSIGDFVSGHNSKMTMPIEDITKELKNIHAKYGFYTVLGNHDWWIDGESVVKELLKNNIKVLANSNTKVKVKDKTVYIAGVTDLSTMRPVLWKALDGTDNPTILLTHNPDVFVQVPKEVNLTLAGHVHGGQVRLPFIGATIIPSKYGDKYSQGLIEENDKRMIVTRGIGNSIMNIRINCIPEIVVIEFE